ncbi:MAG: DUF4430 domain-containing protein [Eubacterium sp.]
MKRISRIVFIILLCFNLWGCKSTEDTKKIGTCTILVECSTIFDNLEQLDASVKEFVPESGIILGEKEVDILEGDSVYDILKRELKKEKILMEASFTGKSAYVEGIDNIYEFSCGELSGWMYCVNREYPGKSCSDYEVKDGDVIEWHYTCDLGEDLKN